MVVGRIVGWSLFGAAVRWWQIGIQMRSHVSREALLGYPVYMGIGGAVGYWLAGVEQRQLAYITDKRDALLAKRERVKAAAEGREPNPIENQGGVPTNTFIPSPGGSTTTP